MPGRLPWETGDVVLRALERDGWMVDRVRGSHFILRHPTKAGAPKVPRHAGQIVKPGTMKDILTKAGLSVEQFRALL